VSIWAGRELGASAADELPHDFALVTPKVIENDDVAGAKRGDEDLLDIGLEAFAVDRPFK